MTRQGQLPKWLWVTMGIGAVIGALSVGYFLATQFAVHWSLRAVVAVIGGIAGITVGVRVALIVVKVAQAVVLTMQKLWERIPPRGRRREPWS